MLTGWEIHQSLNKKNIILCLKSTSHFHILPAGSNFPPWLLSTELLIILTRCEQIQTEWVSQTEWKKDFQCKIVFAKTTSYFWSRIWKWALFIPVFLYRKFIFQLWKPIKWRKKLKGDLFHTFKGYRSDKGKWKCPAAWHVSFFKSDPFKKKTTGLLQGNTING